MEHLLQLKEWSGIEIEQLLDLAADVKKSQLPMQTHWLVERS